MKCKLSFSGQGFLRQTAFSLGRITQQGGSEAGRQVQNRDPKVCSVDRKGSEAWLSKGHDTFKEDEVIGAEATWLLEGCRLQPRGKGRRWKAGGTWGPSLRCQLCG